MIDFDHWTFLNHGAFGGALRSGFDRANQWRAHLEKQPLRYHDRELLPHLAYSTRRLASFMNLHRCHITLTPNVTSGINSVLSSYARQVSDSHVITWDTTYGSVKKMAAFYSKESSEIPFQQKYLDQYCVSDHPTSVFVQALFDHVERASINTSRSVLLILDHITSNTALTIPFNEIAKEFKARFPCGLVLVDGAHGLLAQDIQISQDIDFYLSNGHKWLSCPRGVAMLYARPEHHGWLFPSVLSHGMDETDLLSRFLWDGCRDYAAALALPAVLDYWERLGPHMVREQMRAQLQTGISILVSELYPGSAKESWSGFITLASPSTLSPMALVKLPITDYQTSTNAKKIQDLLYEDLVEVPIKCINGSLYVRVSCHLYNKDEDFYRLALGLKRIIYR